MDSERPDVEERLRRAYGSTDVPAGTRRRHLGAIGNALDRARPRVWRRRLTGVLVAAAVAATPVGVALASQAAVPGETLYPVKRAVESVRRIVDAEVVARHRVDELAVLLERDAPPERIEPAVRRAEQELARREARAALRQRYALLAAEAERRTAGERPTGALPRPDPEVEVDLPQPEPTRPHPTGEPSPEPTSRPTAETSPSPSPAEDAHGTIRYETHRAFDAGTVTLAVADDGVRLHEVEPVRGWVWRAERSREPEGLIVAFGDGERQVVLTARMADGEVVVSVHER